MHSCDSCEKEYDSSGSLTGHYKTYPEHRPEDWDACPECGVRYHNLGGHWYYNPEHRPSLTDHQREIITGSLMSDGWIARGGKTPSFAVEMISPNYLRHLDNELGILSTGISIHRTAEEKAAENRRSGFSKNADPEDYHDLHRLTSRVHPELQEFSDWYKTGEKVWPSDDIELTPTVLKHFYVGDGCLDASNSIKLTMSNELDRIDRVKKMFRRTGFTPSNVSISESTLEGYEDTKIVNLCFDQDTSREMLEYMGPHLPDFAYKWPEEYR